MPNAIINPNIPTSPPNVARTTQLPDAFPDVSEGTVSQVETKSLRTDLSIDIIEKDTGPALTGKFNLITDRSHTQTDIDSL
jgi:hypothetical protein